MATPNIIFILMDDMGWMDLGCYGSTFYETPNLDRLSAEGMRFTDAYASCPVCSPSRASVMTGKYPATLGITNWIGANDRGKLKEVPYVDHLPLEETSIATRLSGLGYRTWHVGKWHLGERPYYPDRHGFDVNVGGCDWGMPKNGYFSPYGIETLEDGPEGEYLTDRLTDEAIGLIRNNAAGRPFFLNLWHYSVHTPIEAKEEDIVRFRRKAAELGLDKIEPMAEGECFPCEHKKHLRVQRRIIQSDPVYAAMIYNLDWNIGRLLEALEATGQRDNTVIFFTSDNGGLSTAEGSPTCNFPLSEGKGWMYEGGIREPLIVSWPGVIPEGSVCNVPVSSVDFYPTLAELAGADPNEDPGVEGESLVPLLTGNGELEREAIYWHYPHYGNQGGTPFSSVRKGDYKLIEFYEDNRVELYNLREDMSERTNLAEALPDRVRELRALLDNWKQRTGAVIPTA